MMKDQTMQSLQRELARRVSTVRIGLIEKSNGKGMRRVTFAT